MPAPHVLDFVYIIVILAGGIIAGVAPFIISDIFRPRTVNKKTLLTYECGMDTYGTAWDIRFGAAYYLYALIFLAFDVDILYLFPVAAAYDRVSGLHGVLGLFIFVGILALAIAYVWVKGVFTWAIKREV
ncbi:MAG: NADH-quinone oxidoreductase subunit A, partial [Deltaproteobacteria bacterium]|nr:NADH-quinone oxidoreductase subunit A [Deltaproteobacteria bacterium]